MPAPAWVTPWRASSGITLFGSKIATATCAKPASRPAISHPIPPTCVSGNTNACRSSGCRSSTRTRPLKLAIRLASVCCAPFGSAVVPEEYRIQRTGWRAAGSSGGGAGSSRGIALGQRAVDDQHVEVVALRAQRLRERGIVEVAKRRRNAEQSRLRLVRDEARLALAVDRQDRVLHRAEPRERGREHECLERGGQHPRYRRVGADPARVQTRGRAQRGVAIARERERAVALVDREQRVRCRRRARLDELPDRARWPSLAFGSLRETCACDHARLSAARRRSSTLSTLPAAFTGSAGTISIRRGTL